MVSEILSAEVLHVLRIWESILMLLAVLEVANECEVRNVGKCWYFLCYPYCTK